MGDFLFPNTMTASRGQFGSSTRAAFVQNGLIIATKVGKTGHEFMAAAYCDSAQKWLGSIRYAILVDPVSRRVTLRTQHTVLLGGVTIGVQVQGMNTLPVDFVDALNAFKASELLEDRDIALPPSSMIK
jgi:hypothetical protein